MTPQTFISIAGFGFTVVGICVSIGIFIATVRKLEEKIAEHRATDDKMFEKFNGFHSKHFDSIRELENWKSGQIERNISTDKFRDEIKAELKEIKEAIDSMRELILKIYDKDRHSS